MPDLFAKQPCSHVKWNSLKESYISTNNSLSLGVKSAEERGRNSLPFRQKYRTGSWPFPCPVIVTASGQLCQHGIDGGHWSHMQMIPLVDKVDFVPELCLQEDRVWVHCPTLAAVGLRETHSRSVQASGGYLFQPHSSWCYFLYFLIKWLALSQGKASFCTYFSVGSYNLCFFGKGYFLKELKGLKVHTLFPLSIY